MLKYQSTIEVEESYSPYRRINFRMIYKDVEYDFVANKMSTRLSASIRHYPEQTFENEVMFPDILSPSLGG